jgi:alpha-beta hydrolase superfamily lysophospholipase
MTSITRRQFGALTAGTLAGCGLSGSGLQALGLQASGGTPAPVLDIAEWSYYWYGVERVKLARGTMVSGSQLYVEHWVPRQIRHPYSVVMIHGGYGQGTDWLSTPDGRRGWASLLLEQGYKVYVIDRPGQGRNPHHPWVHGQYDAQAPTFERVAATVKSTQWPGSGDANDPAVAQVAASMGQPMALNVVTVELWRSRGAMLLDDIGPSILLSHGDGVVFARATRDARPALVKGIVAVEPSTPAPAGTTEFVLDRARLAERGISGNGPMIMMERNNRETLQLALDWMRDVVEMADGRGSPSIDSSGGRLQPVQGGTVQTAPAVIPNADTNRNAENTSLRLADQGGFFVGIGRRKMPYGTIPQGQMFVQYMIPAEQRYPYPIVMLHGGGAQGTHMMGLGRRPGWVHYFVQAGYAVYWLDRPSYGRSPYHPDALSPSHLPNVPPYEPLLEATNVFKTGQWPGPGGMEDEFINQFMACESGNTSDEAFHSELVWPGGAELVDRIGPCILHGHAFGGFFNWGVADRRPDLVKGIVCMEINGNPFERQLRWGLTAGPMTYDPPVTDPAQFTLVDHTPPADSPRPIASPYKLQAEPARKWKNLQKIPIAWLTSEFGAGGSPVANVAFLTQVGCQAELIRLRDFGIHGNGNLMPMEKNNHEVFTVLRDWLDKKVAAPR